MAFRVFICILVFSIATFNLIIMINAFLKLIYSQRTFEIILKDKVNSNLIKGINEINVKKENLAVAFRLAQYEIENLDQHEFLFEKTINII